MNSVDVMILGAGAAGMMCAIEAAKRGRSVLVLDHSKTPGDKIRISGGGRCNFTNIHTSPKNFISQNPHFCISAISRYKPDDFINLLKRYDISFHEKTLGQLFCDGSAVQIIKMLRNEMDVYGAKLQLDTALEHVTKTEAGFVVRHSHGTTVSKSLVVATGGKSIPKMGATGLGYEIALKFGLKIVETRPGLVPLTFDPHLLERLKPLAGVAVEAKVHCGKTHFSEAALFTHRGISGPAILQISSYWREGSELSISMAPHINIFEELRTLRSKNGKQALQTALASFLPKKLAQIIATETSAPDKLADMPDDILRRVDNAVNKWAVKPAGSEGYRTAEVTVGGVDTKELNSKTMESNNVAGLYFIGEVVDVTGWLGGYNFQWAWASGWSAGQVV